MKYGVWSCLSRCWCFGTSLDQNGITYTRGADGRFETDDINFAYRYQNLMIQITNGYFKYLVKERPL